MKLLVVAIVLMVYEVGCRIADTISARKDKNELKYYLLSVRDKVDGLQESLDAVEKQLPYKGDEE